MTPAEDRLIRSLAQGLRPVRPLPPPMLRAAGWIAVVLAAGVGLCAVADLSGLQRRMAMPDLRWAAVGAVLTAVCAGVATFQVSVPGRSRAWMLLPLPPAALWLGASGWGCMRAETLPGMHPATPHDSMGCGLFILAVSVPLSALLAVLLRRAAPLRPGRVAAMAGLAAAAAAASLLVLFHPEDASFVDVLVHAAAVALVIVANKLWSSRVLRESAIAP